MTGNDQPAIFIVSGGRTGTQFLGQQMRRMIENCHSVHEADVLWINRTREWPRKIRQFGLYRMTVGKFSAKYSLRALSFARITGRIDDARAVAHMRNIRRPYMESIGKAVFLEANGQYSLLIDLIPQAFPNSRIVYIIRDPRDWVRSWMNMENAFYTIRDLRSWLLGGRLKPKHFPDDPYIDRWSQMDQFERLSWLWQKENGVALQLAQESPQIRVLRFEDLFTSPTREAAFNAMLQFVSSFPNGYQASWELKPDLLDRKVHTRSQGGFPAWRDWDRATAWKLDRICRPLMSRLGYGSEPEWIQKTGAKGDEVHA